MTDKEKAQAKARLEKRYSQEYGKPVTVDTTAAKEGVLFGYALNIQKCIGCRRGVKACVEENNQSRGAAQEIEWIRVLKMEKGAFTPEKMKQGYPAPVGIQVGGNAYSAAGVTLDGERYDHHARCLFGLLCRKGSRFVLSHMPPCVKVC